jgi:hypothetical protein
MPVATQAALKGLTPQQTEELGITLILNNTYHLNLRPGTKVLDAAGGAHKFQGWRRNLLTVSFVLHIYYSKVLMDPFVNGRIPVDFKWLVCRRLPRLPKKAFYSRAHSLASPPCLP